MWKHVDLLLGLRLATAIGVGVLVLIVSARLLRIQEFDEALGRIMRRLVRRRTEGSR